MGITVKKIVFNSIFLFAVFALTIYGVFHGQNLAELNTVMGSCRKIWLLPGVGMVLFFIWGEALVIWYMMNSFAVGINKRTCFLFSSVGFFFSCITPSASGGQPMQIYYMKKHQIPIPVSTVILMIVTITYKFVLVMIGVGILLGARPFLHQYLGEILPVFYLGLILNILCVFFMSFLVFHPVMAKKVLSTGLNFMEGIQIFKHKEERHRKLQESMEVYADTACYLKTHFRIILQVFFITFLQRMALFSVTWFVYKAYGLSGTGIIEIIFLQAVISVSVDMLPLPGGMGISESLFLIIFQPVFGGIVLPAMILSRGLGYYGQLLISAVFTGVAQLTIGEKRNVHRRRLRL